MRKPKHGPLASLLSIGFVTLLAVQGCGSQGARPSDFSDAGGRTKVGAGNVDGGGNGDPGDTIGGDFGPSSDAGTGPVGLDAGCATATAKATRQPVYMLFVVDGSNSMGQDGKWTALSSALDSIFDDFKAKADPNFGAGLITYSDANDPTCDPFLGGCTGPYPSNVDVPIGFVDAPQHTKLRQRIDGTQQQGDTPTFAALTGGYAELEKFTPTAPLAANGKKVLVVLTDGVPTDGSSAQITQAASRELAAAAPKGPITTFVIGVGVFPSTDLQSFDPAFLGKLAQAGGAAPSGCNPNETSDLNKVCYFEVDPKATNGTAQLTQKFIDAINKIRGQVTSCELALHTTSSGPIDPTKVNVVFTDAAGKSSTVPQDPQNGWTYDNPTNPTKVILHGQACQKMTTEVTLNVSIVLGCATVGPK